MIIKPLCTCIALSLACAFTGVVNAKEVRTTEVKKIETIADSKFAIDPVKIQRLSQVKSALGISGISDHAVKAQYGTELNAEVAGKIKDKLSTLKDIQDKYAFLMAINAVLKTDHLHLNSNFPMNWSTTDKQFLDAVYTAYLSLVFTDSKGKSQAEIDSMVKQLERETPFKLYDADLKKVKAFLKK